MFPIHSTPYPFGHNSLNPFLRLRSGRALYGGLVLFSLEGNHSTITEAEGCIFSPFEGRSLGRLPVQGRGMLSALEGAFEMSLVQSTTAENMAL